MKKEYLVAEINRLRREKKAELQLARAEEAAKVAKDINPFATKINTTVDTIDSVAYGSNYFGKFGMEPKVLSVIAATKSGMTSPIKGASAVYTVQVDGKAPAEGMDANLMKTQLEQGYRNKVRQITEVLRQKATIVDTRNEHF